MFLFFAVCLLWFLLGSMAWFTSIERQYQPLKSNNLALKVFCFVAYLLMSGPIGCLYVVLRPLFKGRSA